MKKKNEYVIINNADSLDVKKMNINEENIIILDYDKTINDLYKSYNNSKKQVFTQFKNDFPRCYYIINDNIEKNINTFVNYFEFSLYEYGIKPYIILMLCTQAIMGTALQILYKNIETGSNLYIGELQKKTNLIFKFITKKDSLYLKISKVLRIFTITQNNKDITLKKISINIFLSLNEKDKLIIIYKILKN